jgi:hypothetical protein
MNQFRLNEVNRFWLVIIKYIKKHIEGQPGLHGETLSKRKKEPGTGGSHL